MCGFPDSCNVKGQTSKVEGLKGMPPKEKGGMEILYKIGMAFSILP